MPNYVLKYKTGEFVGIDSGSGGYPYQTNIEIAHKFLTMDDAKKYLAIFSNELDSNIYTVNFLCLLMV